MQSGLSLALACDLRFASTTARLGSGTLRFGLMPDEGGHYLLVQVLGLAGALDFMLRARLVDAPEARQLGLVGEVSNRPSCCRRPSSRRRRSPPGPSWRCGC